MLDTSTALEDSFVHHLPPNLIKLCMGYGIAVEEEWAALPRTLKWIGDGPSHCLSPSQLSSIPPFITRFEYSHRHLDRQGIDALPKSLLRLKLHRLSDADVEVLPPRLTELTLNSETCSPLGISKLPQSLRYLCLNGDALEREECFANLPPILTRLVLRHMHSNVPPSALAALLKGLTALHVHNCGTNGLRRCETTHYSCSRSPLHFARLTGLSHPPSSHIYRKVFRFLIWGCNLSHLELRS